MDHPCTVQASRTARAPPHLQTAAEIKAFRERLIALAQAWLRINESLDLDTVLQEALDCARSLTETEYGIIALMDHERRMQHLLWSGISERESHKLRDIHHGQQLCEYIARLQGPLRVDDFQGHLQSLGIEGSRVSIPAGSNTRFLAAPIIHHGHTGGGIFLADTEPGRKFTPEDEETLMMFASQAALVIANVRRYREEQQARADLEALIDTRRSRSCCWTESPQRSWHTTGRSGAWPTSCTVRKLHLRKSSARRPSGLEPARNLRWRYPVFRGDAAGHDPHRKSGTPAFRVPGNGEP